MQFTTTVPFDIEFQGEHITGTMRRLSRPQFLRLAPLMPKPPEPGEPAPTTDPAAMESIAEALKECVVEMHGIEVDGRPANITHIAEELFFTGLLSELFGKLVEASVLGLTDAEKSAAQPPALLSASNLKTPGT